MEFDFKNGETYFESLISSSFDELHCSTIVYMNHICFRIYLLLHQEGPKKPQIIFSLLSRGWNSLPGACSDLDLTILSGDIWRQLTAASRQTVRTPLRSADWSLSAAQTDFAGLDWGRRLNTNCLYFRVRSRRAGDGDGAVGCRLLTHRTGHWPSVSDHMIRSQPLICWPPKIVSKVLEEISFKDFGGKSLQRFWRKFDSPPLLSASVERVGVSRMGDFFFKTKVQKCT